jgi:hypothetical protein
MRPDTASAAVDCSTRYLMDIEIIDLDTSARMTVAGSTIRISPDPQDNAGIREYVDNGANDDSSTVGRIRENEACSASAADYTITLQSLPSGLACDIVVGSQVTALTGSNASDPVKLYIEDCSTVTVTPTGTVTATPGPASSITVNSSQPTLNCSNTAIITVQVKNAAGASVGGGVPVTITASPSGAVSPTGSQPTANDGSVFVFYTSAANAGGLITITATSGEVTGSTTLTVNCGTAATATSVPATSTTAPPPTLAVGAISPPNTGDAGLGGSSRWQSYLGMALIISALAGGIALLRARI